MKASKIFTPDEKKFYKWVCELFKGKVVEVIEDGKVIFSLDS